MTVTVDAGCDARAEAAVGGRSHFHIAGVCTKDGAYHSRYRVVEGVEAGERWRTFGGVPGRGSGSSTTVPTTAAS